MNLNLSLRIYLTANIIVITFFLILNFHLYNLDMIAVIAMFSTLLSLPALIVLYIFFSRVQNKRIGISGMWSALLAIAGLLGCIPGGVVTFFLGLNADDIWLFLFGAASAWLAILLQCLPIHKFFKSIQQ